MGKQQPYARFTERARRVIDLAEKEARRLQHDYIGAEHLLLGIVSEGQGAGAKVLAFKDITLEKTREAVEHIMGRGAAPSPAEIELTPRAQHILASAVDEANRNNQHFIGTEHLLLGLLREEQGVAAGALDLLGADRDELRNGIARIIHSTQIRSAEQPGEQAASQASEGSAEPVQKDQRDRFDKFTEQARQALSLAQEEAQHFKHRYIGTEHLLLGLMRQNDTVAMKVLHNLGVEPKKVQSAIKHIIGRHERIVLGEVGLTPRAKKAIELAVDEARRLNHHYIGTEHLLLGLVREGEGIAAGVLMSLDVDLDRVRAETLKVLGEKNEEQDQ